MHQEVYKAYHRATHTVAKTRQIVMLYDGILRNLKHAKDAMESGDVMTRFQKLVRAGDIIMGLQSSLDFEMGGDVARILYDFYSTIDARILSTLNSNNPELIEQTIQEIRDMRDVWAQIDKNEGEVSSVAASAAAPNEPNPITVSA
jgi:flagellar secretion chaperone FliS